MLFSIVYVYKPFHSIIKVFGKVCMITQTTLLLNMYFSIAMFIDSKHVVIERRYKEFVMLDTKLRQFHGNILVQLPSKKTFRNLDKAFVELRCRELEHYLLTLIQPSFCGVQNSQILANFLSNDYDPSLFLPKTVAGKMIKAVPSILKRDVR